MRAQTQFEMSNGKYGDNEGKGAYQHGTVNLSCEVTRCATLKAPRTIRAAARMGRP